MTEIVNWNTGCSKGREPYEYRVPIIVDEVTTIQGGRESRLQGKGGQVELRLRVQKDTRNANYR